MHNTQVNTISFLQVQQYTDARFVSMMNTLTASGLLALNEASSLQSILFEHSGGRLTSSFAERQLRQVTHHLVQQISSNGVSTVYHTVQREPLLEPQPNNFHLSQFTTPMFGVEWLQQLLAKKVYNSNGTTRLYEPITHCATVCIVPLAELTRLIQLASKPSTKAKASKEPPATEWVQPTVKLTQPFFCQPDNRDARPKEQMFPEGTTFSSSWNLLMFGGVDIAEHITLHNNHKVLQLAIFLHTHNRECVCYTNSLYQILMALHTKYTGFESVMLYLVYNPVVPRSHRQSSAIKPKFVIEHEEQQTSTALFVDAL